MTKFSRQNLSLFRHFPKNLFFSLLFLLRHDIESIREREHHVARNAVVPRLGATLLVHHVARVGELLQDVEALEFGEEFAFEETARELGVPDPVGGVHLALLIAATGVHRQVGGELELRRQVQRRVEADLIVAGVDVFETLATAAHKIIGAAAVQRELVVVVGAEGQPEVVAELVVVDDAAHGRGEARDGRHIDAVVVVVAQLVVDGELVGLSERTREAEGSVGAPIAVHADGSHGGNASLLVELGGVGDGIVLLVVADVHPV